MSKVQTAAEVFICLKEKATCSEGKLCKNDSIRILEEWMAQHQPQTDESDEGLARDIINILDSGYASIHMTEKDRAKRVTGRIARHTAAKVAEAKAKMFRPYGEYCFEGMGRVQLLNWIREKVYGLEPTYVPRDETEAEERGWNRGAEAMREFIAIEVEWQNCKQVEKYQETIAGWPRYETEQEPIPSSIRRAKWVKTLPLPTYKKENE